MSIRAIVIEQIEVIAGRQSKALPPLSDNVSLLDMGLDSLGMAVLVAALEDRLGLDPFADESSSLPGTLGEFISLYENAVA